MDKTSNFVTSLLTRALTLLSILLFCVSCSSSESASVATGPDKPQIPKEDFEWKGIFKGSADFTGTIADFDAPQVSAQLIIRGKWQGDYFNLHMLQGSEADDTWVENLIYNGKFYTITRNWHTKKPPLSDEILGKCFETTLYNAADHAAPLPITVDSLNGILESSRFVGLEVIDGTPMNHFRTTCLSASSIPTEDPALYTIVIDGVSIDIPPFFPIKIFSDIYVPEGQKFPWIKWLQYGDGVGPDPQNDEWFLLDEWENYAQEIILPRECRDGHEDKRYLQQSVCDNLVPK